MTTYIYILICPITKKVRYVGKSKNLKTRYRQHITKLDKLMTEKRKWLEDLFQKGLLPEIKVIEKCENQDIGRKREQFYVDKYKDTIFNIHNPEKGAKSFKCKYPKRKK